MLRGLLPRRSPVSPPGSARSSLEPARPVVLLLLSQHDPGNQNQGQIRENAPRSGKRQEQVWAASRQAARPDLDPNAQRCHEPARRSRRLLHEHQHDRLAGVIDEREARQQLESVIAHTGRSPPVVRLPERPRAARRPVPADRVRAAPPELRIGVRAPVRPS